MVRKRTSKKNNSTAPEDRKDPSDGQNSGVVDRSKESVKKKKPRAKVQISSEGITMQAEAKDDTEDRSSEKENECASANSVSTKLASLNISNSVSPSRGSPNRTGTRPKTSQTTNTSFKKETKNSAQTSPKKGDTSEKDSAAAACNSTAGSASDCSEKENTKLLSDQELEDTAEVWNQLNHFYTTMNEVILCRKEQEDLAAQLSEQMTRAGFPDEQREMAERLINWVVSSNAEEIPLEKLTRDHKAIRKATMLMRRNILKEDIKSDSSPEKSPKKGRATNSGASNFAARTPLSPRSPPRNTSDNSEQISTPRVIPHEDQREFLALRERAQRRIQEFRERVNSGEVKKNYLENKKKKDDDSSKK